MFTTITRTLALILKEIRDMAQTMAQLEASLKTMNETVTKIGTETAASLELLEELKEAIAAGGGMTSPEVDAALAALEANLKGVDEMVPDATTPTPQRG